MPKGTPNMHLEPVTSLGDLHARAKMHPAYAELAYDAANNLGGHNIRSLADAIHWLRLNEQEAGGNVVAEVNDLIKRAGTPIKRR
jgi:hypothetical protein